MKLQKLHGNSLQIRVFSRNFKFNTSGKAYSLTREMEPNNHQPQGTRNISENSEGSKFPI